MTDLFVIDPLLDGDDARRMLALRRAFGCYRSTLGTRAKYFRESYMYQGEASVPGIELIVDNERLRDAARKLHHRDLVVPSIVYANLLVPGQSLDVHTDIPEYRGVHRRSIPQWLLIVMQHSGLFERWRLPIATAVTYFGGGKGGAFVYFPEGPAGPPQAYLPRHNTGIMLDTDAIFHGVAVVAGGDEAAATFRPGVLLQPETDETWSVRSANGSRVLASYHEDELRYSVSWKAYCFADEDERRIWQEHSDDLDAEKVSALLRDDLEARGASCGLDAGARPELLRGVLEEVYGGTSWQDTRLQRMQG